MDLYERKQGFSYLNGLVLKSSIYCVNMSINEALI